ncbi:S-layer glycoprotein N-glycosyltransferase AglJ [Halocatena halophila]|uniref:S-layer glycoprotein N-glycosyltransferase AglJ n=1 Tax=Halocatena halophila TaxID=2814576 RepID=UPI002ED2D633
MDSDDVCVLIPTYNEAATIGSVIDGFTEQGYTNVLVIDGHSSDDTRTIATEHGARVIEQRRSGKGQAVREALEYVEVPYVVMIDGDATYDPSAIEDLLEPLRNGRAEHVIGDRLEEIDPAAMSRMNRIGNRLINTAFTLIHGRDFADILSGYRAFTRSSIEQMSLSADGLTIETELAVACVKHRIPTAVVPIDYRPRPNGSESNLDPVRDGGRIFHTLYRLARTNNPVFYFGSLGLCSVLFGSTVGAYVGYEWFVVHVSHEALAVLSAFAILLGVQLFMFGVVTDMVVAVNREHTRQIESLAEQLHETADTEPQERSAQESERRH